MDICGNSSSIQIMQKIFDKIKQTGEISAKFLLLHGPSDIGKSTVVKSFSQDLLGDYFYSDFLLIKDLSKHLEKKHSIKIEVDPKNQEINIPGVGNFLDYGAREIIGWSNKSPIGKFKIILIENIERMTDSAANAFLKTMEEPNPRLLIIATTNNVKALMDTIISRAFLIRFDVPCDDDLQNYLVQRYPQIPQGSLQLIISFSMGKTLFAEKLISGGADNLSEILEHYGKYIDLNTRPGNLVDKLSILKKINDFGYLDVFLDAVIFEFAKKNQFSLIDRIITARQMINSNVSVDNALFYIALN